MLPFGSLKRSNARLCEGPPNVLVVSPQRRNMITASPSRPHVKSSDRFLLWSTPYADRKRLCNVGAFSDQAHNRLLEVALASLAPNTRKTYAAGLLRFTQFCDKYNIPEDSRMPASSSLLAMFLAESAASNVSHECARNWMSGLHFWHNAHDAPWFGNSGQVQSVSKGVKKLVPDSSKREPRTPVTMKHMYALREHLSTSNSREIAILALAETTFWGTCRLGETAPPSMNQFDPTYHVTKGAHIESRFTRDGIPFLTLHIPWSKTTGFMGADITLTTRDDLSNPTQSFLWHRLANASVPDNAPLFAYETDMGCGWAALCRDDFMAACNNIWLNAGLGAALGHSFRIGSTTELLLQGVAPDIVQTHGRWKSRASFLRYWRNVEHILPRFFTSLDPVLIARLRASFSSFDNDNP